MVYSKFLIKEANIIRAKPIIIYPEILFAHPKIFDFIFLRKIPIGPTGAAIENPMTVPLIKKFTPYLLLKKIFQLTTGDMASK